MPLTDEWSGLATLLANLIEKYASDLRLENMPIPSVDQIGIGADEKNRQPHKSNIENIIAV